MSGSQEAIGSPKYQRVLRTFSTVSRHHSSSWKAAGVEYEPEASGSLGNRTRKMEDVWTNRSVAQVYRFGWLSEVGRGQLLHVSRPAKDLRLKEKPRFQNMKGVANTGD